MNNKVHELIVRVNIIRPICALLLGKHHAHTHRMAVGLAVMSVGVMIAKCEHYFEAVVVKFILDGMGYGIHGIGLTPFIELLSERTQEVETTLPMADEEHPIIAVAQTEDK